MAHTQEGDPKTGIAIRRIGGEPEIRVCAEIIVGSEPWITLGRTMEHALRALRDSSREVYVAVSGGELAGFIILNFQGPFVGYIQTIAVAPAMRNRGIGRQLIGFAEERILRDGPNVFLCVSSFNHDAQRLYARLGYERVGELKDFVVRGQSEFIMRKTRGPLAEFQALARKGPP